MGSGGPRFIAVFLGVTLAAKAALFGAESERPDAIHPRPAPLIGHPKENLSPFPPSPGTALSSSKLKEAGRTALGAAASPAPSDAKPQASGSYIPPGLEEAARRAEKRVPKPIVGRILDALSRHLRSNPFETWLYWEEEQNMRLGRQSQAPVAVPVLIVPRRKVVIDAAPDLAPEIRAKVLHDGQVFWPRHPFNQSKDRILPFQDRKASGRWPARLTASRSLVVMDGSAAEPRYLFSLKAPTDHPKPGQRQRSKLDLREEAPFSRKLTDYLDGARRAAGDIPGMLIMREVLSVTDRKTGNGFVIRDLSALKSGHYCLPGFSIPFIGRKIAALSGERFETFWAKSFAAPLGRLTAQAAVRYGIGLHHLHPQNFKVELDAAFRPTGRFIFNDTGDWNPYEALVSAAGLKRRLPPGLPTLRNQWPDRSGFLPNLGQLFLFSTIAPEYPSSSDRFISDWETVYLRACRDELEKMLGREVPRGRTPLETSLDRFLFSPAGLEAISRFHAQRPRGS